MPAVHHRVTLSKTEKEKPFRVSCSCGPEGDFSTLGDALNFSGDHMRGVAGINTKEFVDLTKPAVIEEVSEPEAADAEAMKEKQEFEEANVNSAN